MPHSSSIVIVHGGTWTGKEYRGGDEQLMLIPPVGPIKFTDLLSKIEQRIMKPKSRYVYEIYALVRSPSSQTIKMKIMDDVDVDHVLNELEKHILYITTTPINDELLEIVNHQASQGNKAKVTNLATKASLNKFGGMNLKTRELDRGFGRGLDQELSNRDLDRELGRDLLDRDLDRGLDRDLDKGLDRGLDRCLDRDLDKEEDEHQPSVTIRLDDDDDEEVDRDSLDDMDCGSIRQTWVSQGSNHVFEGDQQYTGQWIIPAASYHLNEPTLEEIPDSECIYDDTLRKDAIFASKDRLITVLGLYHLANHVSFLTPRSCFIRYHTVCKNRKAKCSFVLRAQAIGTAWKIHEWSPHSCQKDLRYQSEPTICSKVLGAYFVPNLMTAGVVLRPMDIIAQIEKKFGAKIKYQTALAARNHTLTMVYGDAMKSFERLPKYLWILEHANPGTVTELMLDADGKFRYCFMALAACIRGFKACRPVIDTLFLEV